MVLYIPRKYKLKFITDYLPSVMLDLLSQNRRNNSLINVGSNLGFNAYEALQYILSHLYVDVYNNSYVLVADKNLRWRGYNLDKLLNLITYGSRDVRGSDVYLNIINYVQTNLNALYLKYLNRG